ncbi:MAG: hypothetical protein LQ350_008329 [Teloschistes chrysophthalmus]|nr:MAG: hypothetical protein LQ350_008329 [Niorma chrysophthalma]
MRDSPRSVLLLAVALSANLAAATVTLTTRIPVCYPYGAPGASASTTIYQTTLPNGIISTVTSATTFPPPPPSSATTPVVSIRTFTSTGPNGSPTVITTPTTLAPPPPASTSQVIYTTTNSAGSTITTSSPVVVTPSVSSVAPLPPASTSQVTYTTTNSAGSIITTTSSVVVTPSVSSAASSPLATVIVSTSTNSAGVVVVSSTTSQLVNPPTTTGATSSPQGVSSSPASTATGPFTSGACGGTYSDTNGAAYHIDCGSSYPGYDLPSANVADRDACFRACDAYTPDPNVGYGLPCVGVTYGERSVGGVCYLKYNISSPEPARASDSGYLISFHPVVSSTTSQIPVNSPSTSPTSSPVSTATGPFSSSACGGSYSDTNGAAYHIDCGSSYPGYDLPAANVANRDACFAACDAYIPNANYGNGLPCVGVTYGERTVGGVCYLKYNISSPEPAGASDSGYLISYHPVVSSSTTSQIPVNPATTNRPTSSPTSSATGPFTSAACGGSYTDTSGTAYHIDCGSSYPGYDLPSANIADRDACFAACDAYIPSPNQGYGLPCVGVTYGERTVGGVCYLKYNISSPEPAGASDSGYQISWGNSHTVVSSTTQSPVNPAVSSNTQPAVNSQTTRPTSSPASTATGPFTSAACGGSYTDTNGIPYHIDCGASYPGYDLPSVNVANRDGCFAACDAYIPNANQGYGLPCVGVTYGERTTGGVCYLKYNISSPVPAGATDSGYLISWGNSHTVVSSTTPSPVNSPTTARPTSLAASTSSPASTASDPRSDGRCGSSFAGATCDPNGAYGGCCSSSGYCGNSIDHCGAGCQSGCTNSQGGASSPSSTATAAGPFTSASCGGSYTDTGGVAYHIDCGQAYQGYDLPSLNVPDRDSCFRACDSYVPNANQGYGLPCVACTYGERTTGGVCYLKYNVSSIVPAGATDSGYKLSWANSQSVGSASSTSPAAGNGNGVTTPSTTSARSSTTSVAGNGVATTSAASGSSPPGSAPCPGSDGRTYTDSSGVVNNIQCGCEYPGNDLTSPHFDLFADCIHAADTYVPNPNVAGGRPCIGATWSYGNPGGNCFLKYAITTVTCGNTNDASAKFQNYTIGATPAAPAPSPSTSTSRASSTAAAPVPATTTSSASGSQATYQSTADRYPGGVCPGYNETTYTDNFGQPYGVHCGQELQGDLLPRSFHADSFMRCMQLCTILPGCAAVTYPGDTLDPPRSNCYPYTLLVATRPAAQADLLSARPTNGTTGGGFANQNLCPGLDSQTFKDPTGRTYTIGCNKGTGTYADYYATILNTLDACLTYCSLYQGCIAVTFTGYSQGSRDPNCFPQTALPGTPRFVAQTGNSSAIYLSG